VLYTLDSESPMISSGDAYMVDELIKTGCNSCATCDRHGHKRMTALHCEQLRSTGFMGMAAVHCDDYDESGFRVGRAVDERILRDNGLCPLTFARKWRVMSDEKGIARKNLTSLLLFLDSESLMISWTLKGSRARI